MNPLLTAAVLAGAMLWAVGAQANPAHHPPADPPAPSGTPSAPPAMGSTPSDPMAAPAPPGAPGMPGGGMGGMMDKMMAPDKPGAAAPSGSMPQPSGGCMGGDCGPGAAQTPIYPSLMTLPALTAERRAEIDALAIQQISEGMASLAKGSESLNSATRAGDNAAMQQSVGLMREGLDELEAGIAARRVLSEGKAPRNLALDWFKREMNLASPIPREEPRSLLGVTPLHLFTMVLLVAFGLAMVAMYFFKMRRAAALFGRLEAGSGPPPPGSSPPLAGTPTPSTPSPPPAGAAPPPSGPPAASATPASPANAAPPPEEPPASPTTPATRAEGSALSGVPRRGPASASPLTAYWRGQLRIGTVIMETPSVKTFRLVPSSSDKLVPFTFVPGQFLNVAFWIGGARMNRSYTISSSPTQRDYVDLTVRREPRGAVSRHIGDLLKVDDPIEVGGPVGRFTFSGTEADSIVLIAGGVGITPMMSIARYLTECSWPGDIFLLYACRAPSDFIYQDEVSTLQQRNPKLRVAVTMSRAEGTNWKGRRGRLTKELLTETVPNLASRRIHLCGPPSMMDSTKAILIELGVAAEQLKTELFGATKPTPAAAGTASKPTAPATGPLVTFSKNHKSAKIRVEQTVLELSEELAIGIENSCRVGTCGICKVTMTSGEVAMAVEDSLESDEKANGVILACQAKPKSDIAVQA